MNFGLSLQLLRNWHGDSIVAGAVVFVTTFCPRATIHSGANNSASSRNPHQSSAARLSKACNHRMEAKNGGSVSPLDRSLARSLTIWACDEHRANVILSDFPRRRLSNNYAAETGPFCATAVARFCSIRRRQIHTIGTCSQTLLYFISSSCRNCCAGLFSAELQPDVITSKRVGVWDFEN